MTAENDQTTPHDPTTQYGDADVGQRAIPYPAMTSDMDVQPDHGENTYAGSGRLEGRRALITGGDSGIGRAVAIAFAREGADVAISYMDSEEEDAQQSASWIRQTGRTALLLPGDIQDEQHCETIVARTAEELGGIATRRPKRPSSTSRRTSPKRLPNAGSE